MANSAMNIGELIKIGERPLPDTIKETFVEFPVDGGTIKGIYCTPKNIPITQKCLLLHEIEGDTGGALEVIARRYAKLGIASLRIDFSGHGTRKDEWERYSPYSMLQDAAESLDWLDEKLPSIPKTMLCGFSTGGAIAALLRASEQERISKSCLLYPVLSFKHNFMAAAYPDDELILPLAEWDTLTQWRSLEFTLDKINASLNDNAPFPLTAHTYGSKFIEDCKKLIYVGFDVENLLRQPNLSPLTVIQGSNDPFVPHIWARYLHRAFGRETNFRLVTMEGMSHWVPPKWKASVLYQFMKAATQTPEEFNPRRTVVSLRPQEKGWTSLGAPLQ